MYEHALDPSHADYALLEALVIDIVSAVGGIESFKTKIPRIFRTAIDEVIDAPRTGRLLIDEVEKTEKTYLGTKIEILLRDCLGFPRGSDLDLNVNGVECDIKHTMRTSWSIPKENLEKPAILLREDEQKALCDFGLINIRAEYLNPGQNRDLKKTISSKNYVHIWWVLKAFPYPKNFWLMLDSQERDMIKNAGGATQRLATLFELRPGLAIPRHTVESLANQLDPLNRIRRNGGARDILAPKGIAILFGKNDRKLLEILGYKDIAQNEFVSHIPQTAQEEQILREAKHID